jgi:hypothetical protein
MRLVDEEKATLSYQILEISLTLMLLFRDFIRSTKVILIQ